MASLFAKGISVWTGIGDVRVIEELGELNTKEGRYMAIITTGIGSAENAYKAGKIYY